MKMRVSSTVKSDRLKPMLFAISSSLVLLSWFSLLIPNAQALTTDLYAEVTDVLNLALANCATPTIPTTSLTLAASPTTNNGFTSNCQIVTIDTNAPGYSLTTKATASDPKYASGATTNALLYTTPTSLNPIPVIPATSAAITSPSTLTNNTWGFAVTSPNLDLTSSPAGAFMTSSTYAANNNTNLYANLPIADTPIYSIGQFPGQTSIFHYYYAVQINTAQAAGTYATTVTYTAIGEPVPEPLYPRITAIVPNLASTTAPSGNGGPQFSIRGTNLNLITDPTKLKIGDNSCTELSANSDGTIATCTGPTTNLTTGAKPVSVNDKVSAVTVTYTDTAYPTLQSLSSATCDTAPTIYRDVRDSQLYYIAKLADNKCWMLDNLKYKPNGDSVGTATANFTANQVWSGYLTQNGASSQVAPNQDSPNYVDPAGNDYCTGDANINNQNITKCGLLYNFYTATAGTAPQSTVSGEASGSICPTNWRLPTGGNNVNSDSAVLNASMQAGVLTTPGSFDNTFFANWLPSGAWKGILGGYYVNSFSSRGELGYYWSSTVDDANYAFYFYFSNSRVDLGDYQYFRMRGFGVRCVVGN
jgi:uncharacterized protein (TIGR02145 family)